jgi:hypothetical protein
VRSKTRSIEEATARNFERCEFVHMILVNRAAARSRTGTFPPSPACSPPVLTVAQPLGRLGFLFPHDHVRGGAGTAVGSTTLTSRPGSSPTRARLWGTPRSGGGATSGRGARAESLANWESPPMAGDRTRKSRGRRRTMAAAAGTSGAGWSLCR